MLNASQITGVFPPVPTPFDAQGEVAPTRLAENLTRLSGQGLTGFIILGSNGEYVYLDEDEKLRLFQAAREAIPSDQLFVAGTGAESTRATLRLTRAAAEIGANAVIIITPAYYKSAMSGEALIKHFTTIAEASPVPVILYNMPAYTGLDLPVETILTLAAHPNIIGLKESSGNIVKIAELVREVGERKLDFAVLAGSASFLLATLAVGGQGGIMASANVAANHCLQIYRLHQSDPQQAAHLQQSLLPLNAAVTTRYGVAGLKYVMEQQGLYGGPVRPPLLPLTDKGLQDINAILAKLG